MWESAIYLAEREGVASLGVHQSSRLQVCKFTIDADESELFARELEDLI